jgi:hypothetical protein
MIRVDFTQWLNPETTAAMLAAQPGDALGRMPSQLPERLYRGVRPEGGGIASVMIHEGGREVRPLPTRRDLRDHSPDGFSFGYGGSGPSQLSLALCADALADDNRALRVYQEFKWRFVAVIEGPSFEIGADEVRRIVASIERSGARAS